MRKKRVAYCGTRGIPANYGGFETAVDKITLNLINEDTESIIFCRSNEINRQVESIDSRKLVFVKGSKSRVLDTFITSIRTGLYLIKNRKEFDFVFWFNNANLPGIILSRFSGIPMAVNTDGLEWRRAKWSWPFKLYYFLSSYLICIFCKDLISDSQAIQNYYNKVFMKKTHFIPYGSPEIISVPNEKRSNILNKYNLMAGKYFLQITRFEPDNLPLDIIKSFVKSRLHNQGYKFVLIGYKGGTPYSEEIMKYNNVDGIIVLPANYDQSELTVLREEAFAYVHGNSVGGTNPALLEAMAYCKRILAIEGPFSSEVLGGSGLLFKTENLDECFQASLEMKEQLSETSQRLKERYTWKAVSASYLDISRSEFNHYSDYLEERQIQQLNSGIKGEPKEMLYD